MCASFSNDILEEHILYCTFYACIEFLLLLPGFCRYFFFTLSFGRSTFYIEIKYIITLDITSQPTLPTLEPHNQCYKKDKYSTLHILEGVIDLLHRPLFFVEARHTVR